MLPTKYFNLRLLCIASALIMTASHASPFFIQRFSSTSTSNPAPSEPVNVLQSIKDRPTANLTSLTHHQLDAIYADTHHIRNAIDQIKSNNKWIKLIALLSAAQTAYIIDQDPRLNTKMYKVIDAINEKYAAVTTYLRNAISHNPNPAHGHPENDSSSSTNHSDSKA